MQQRLFSRELFLLKLKTGEKSDNEKVAELQDELAGIASLSEVFKPKTYIFEGLSEAVVNCIDHAYTAPDMDTPKYPYAGHRWWATACLDPSKRALRFFVYDQGVGIAETIGKKQQWMSWIDKALSAAGLIGNDADVIEGALVVGRTRTELRERGKGLKQMMDVVGNTGAGYMRIVSGHGDVAMDSTKTIKKTNLNSHIGGTLVEWSLPIDAFLPS